MVASPFNSGLGFNRFGVGNFNRFGFGRVGCFNCGFGFGFGFGTPWGWGASWYGLNWWDPFWFDPWYGPALGLDYGYYPYPDPSINYYPPYDDQSSLSYPSADSNQDSANSNVAAESAPSPVPVALLYFKNRAIVPVADYWIADNKLHYVDGSGVEITIDMDQLDLQRTVNENAKHGVQFTLKPGPGSSTAPPDTEPNAAPAPAAQTDRTS